MTGAGSLATASQTVSFEGGRIGRGTHSDVQPG
eukprot:CAMPEP_0115715718 /NCGR_PEP_ID=MMETSP0272-20121206/75949_1 /TAXON_ID=71861 /ORGANISM="Scrippsiella trochoidea, Strain CCMP3099" /LENGTH=32 /DNA_ID= /DNA_START= /DNA_END= /DNA_ORIENTATION=